MFKHALLSLLAQRPRHGYELKSSFEEALGGTWQVNIGQIYTTLGRLERDGLVQSQEVAQPDRPDKRVYSITPAGQARLQAWFVAPAENPHRLRDRFFVKLVFYQLAGYDDVAALIQEQRRVYLRRIRDLSDIAQALENKPYVALLIEGAILHLEADLAWLERCEEKLN
jgi:DNA-binding PadR family transcriptional regulator